MGIYDRDYIRRQPPQPGAYGAGGLRGMRMWSVNTWLIVICAIVFVIDGLTPLQTVEMGIEWAEGVNPAQLKGTDVVITEPAITLRGRGGQPIQGVRQVIQRTPGGPEVVGEQTVLFQHVLTKYLHFSTQRGFLRIEFWRFIGFQFLHANLMHLLFNMIGLYFFGPMVERYLGSKRYLAFYLLCGIFGALMYSLLNLGGVIAEAVGGSGVRVPGLLFNDAHTPLVGASAGVFGVLMAGAYLAPRAMVLVFFFLPMQLRTLAYALVGIALFTVVVAGRNAGGEAGHLGGAIAGFYFIRHPRHLHGFFDILGRVDPTSHHYRGKGAPARGRAVAKGAGARGAPSRAEVDRVLDKVHSQGLASLTDREKRILRQASERDG